MVETVLPRRSLLADQEALPFYVPLREENRMGGIAGDWLIPTFVWV
jgi:hypothetical protein